VNDPLLVGGFQRLRDLPGDRQGLVEWNRTARDPLREIVPLDQLHDQCTDAVGFFEAVDVRDVGMVERRQGLGFAGEPRHAIEIAGERLGQNLQGHVAIQLRVACAIHFAHSADAYFG
jgi:hypothetical protein